VHKTKMGGDTPSQDAGLSAKEMTNGTVSQVRTIGFGPFASFVSKYRSTSKFLPQLTVDRSLIKAPLPEDHQDLDIDSCTPAPTPPRSPTLLHARDPREMSDEECIQALLHFQQRQ